MTTPDSKSEENSASRSESAEPSSASGVQKDAACGPRPSSSAAGPHGPRDGEAQVAATPGPALRGGIRVTVIAPEQYPAFQRDKDHSLAGLSVEARLDDLDDFCARLLVAARLKRAASAMKKSA
jgi:hypothetical protein